jgi:hypothetical protein
MVRLLLSIFDMSSPSEVSISYRQSSQLGLMSCSPCLLSGQPIRCNIPRVREWVSWGNIWLGRQAVVSVSGTVGIWVLIDNWNPFTNPTTNTFHLDKDVVNYKDVLRE